MKILRLKEVHENQVTSALADELWKELRLTNPVPAVFKCFQGDWGGLCLDNQFTEEGEIEISEEYHGTTRTVSIARARRQLVETYVHELSHRLTPGHGHDAVFSTLNLALFIRAKEIYPRMPLHLSLYDFQDHVFQDHLADSDAPEVSAADAFAFIYTQALDLAPTTLLAGQLVTEIEVRWKSYKKKLADRPKLAAREAGRLLDLQHQVEDIKKSRNLWARGFAAMAIIFFILVFHYWGR